MKKSLIVLLFASATFLTNSAKAQLPIPGVGKVTKLLPKPIFGVKIGGNFNQLSTSGSELAQSYKPSFLPGVFGGLEKGKWGIRAELIINFAKYTYSFKSLGDGTFSNIYLDIPFLVEYKIIPHLWAEIGPQFSRTLSVSAAGSGNFSAVSNPSDYFKSNSLSGVIGAEARLLHFVAGARYILGFTDIHNTNVGNATSVGSNAWNARTAQIYVGFRFL